MIKKSKNTKEANELFYLDKDGKKQDAALHEELLAGGDDRRQRIWSAKSMMEKFGTSREAALEIYGLLPEDLEPTTPDPNDNL